MAKQPPQFKMQLSLDLQPMDQHHLPENVKVDLVDALADLMLEALSNEQKDYAFKKEGGYDEA